MNPFDNDDKEHIKQFTFGETDSEQRSNESVDPLDEFMGGLVDSDIYTGAPNQNEASLTSDDDETPAELMDRVRKSGGLGTDSLVVNDDGEQSLKRRIDSLPVVDHSKVTYPNFISNFYKEHESIFGLTQADVTNLRRQLSVSVSGSSIPRCVCSFAHLNLPDSVLSVLRSLEYHTPTPIQSQSIPCLLSGRDVIGIAMTGSGKTMSYLIPAIVHTLGNERQTPNPRVLIVCPTRELAIQIEQEAYRFARKGNNLINTIALTGGLSKHEQFKELHKGVDIVVGNPGRILDLVQMKKGLDLSFVTFCVLDEADRMFKMGFENQVRTIIQRIRPDRQIALFSATMPPKIERMCRDILRDPIRVVVGAVGQASSLIDRNVFVAHSDEEKLVWLKSNLPVLINSPESRLMVFVNSRSRIEDLIAQVRQITPVNVAGLSSEMDQQDRMRIMSQFKLGGQQCPILIATDVAARGLDIPRISCVIEYDAARDFDTHTHRIGRTGRAGFTGTSWTLLTKADSKLAAFIVESMEALGFADTSTRHPELVALAMTHAPFRASRILDEEKRGSSSSPRSDHGQKTMAWNGMESHFVKKARLNAEGDITGAHETN